MSPTLTATQPATTLNGLDTHKMVETVAALKASPTLAKFEFRARNRWISGGENRSAIKDFHGAGAEDTSRHQAFEFTNGEPPVILGHNEGANPVEFLLHALAGCVTTTTVLHATARGENIGNWYGDIGPGLYISRNTPLVIGLIEADMRVPTKPAQQIWMLVNLRVWAEMPSLAAAGVGGVAGE